MPYEWRDVRGARRLNGAHVSDEDLAELDERAIGLYRLVSKSPYVTWWSWFFFESRMRNNDELDALKRLYLPQWVLDQEEQAEQGRYLPGGLNLSQLTNWTIDEDALPEVDDDTLLVGVIDSGVPLCHKRLRDIEGETRIISSWQMSTHIEPAPVGPSEVPFGRELYSREINDLIAAHTTADGQLDEAGFNRDAGLVDLFARQGPRELVGGFSHGAAVVDLAAGIDPKGEPVEIKLRSGTLGATTINPAQFAKRVKIIVVNLPNRAAIGLSGEFLDFFVLCALHRITDVAKALWQRNNPDAPDERVGGYPLMMNLSYGRQAGDKAFGNDKFGENVDKIIGDYREDTKPAHGHGYGVCDLMVPAGNDNLARAYSDFQGLPPGAKHSQTLRVQPGDQSSSYVEIWAGGGDGLQLEIAVTPPGDDRRPIDIDFMKIATGTVWALGPTDTEFAQLQTIHASDSSAGALLSIAPTEQPEAPDRVAPAGAWRIHVRNAGGQAFDLNMMVQSEQSLLDRTTTSRRAYFEENGYQRFDKVHGGAVDSFSIDRKTGAVTANDFCENYGAPPGTDTKLRRHGTVISTASDKTACIAGYRLSDGAPAPYSSTGIGRSVKDGRGAPTAALPSDDGAAHPGVLTAGASDGSVAIAQGTSFASALATRHITEQRLIRDGTRRDLNNLDDADTGDNLTASEKLGFDAGALEGLRPFQIKHKGLGGGNRPNTVAKFGKGRISPSRTRPVTRLG